MELVLSKALKQRPIAPSPRRYGAVFIVRGLEELILPALWEQQTFIDKAGPEIIGQMWAFEDKGGRKVCLVPEATAPVQEMWRDDWSKRMKGRSVFYVARCYRYERPQAGRYREFTQIGIELLGEDADDARAISLLRECLDLTGVEYTMSDAVKRGLAYYVADGFEAECTKLGAQKQIAGGGRYAEGVGWAIGLDRLLLALE